MKVNADAEHLPIVDELVVLERLRQRLLDDGYLDDPPPSEGEFALMWRTCKAVRGDVVDLAAHTNGKEHHA